MLVLVKPLPEAPGRQARGGGGRAQQQGPGGSGAQAAMLRNTDGSLVNAAAAIQAFKSDKNMMDQVGSESIKQSHGIAERRALTRLSKLTRI